MMLRKSFSIVALSQRTQGLPIGAFSCQPEIINLAVTWKVSSREPPRQAKSNRKIEFVIKSPLTNAQLRGFGAASGCLEPPSARIIQRASDGLVAENQMV
jgi:hypothetical protein